MRGPGLPSCQARFTVDPGRVDIRCMSLTSLLEDAFGIPVEQFVMPWPTVGRTTFPVYDIAAKRPEGASDDQISSMLQALLAGRFGLILHRETRKEPCFGLVVDKAGLKLKEASADGGGPALAQDAGLTGSAPSGARVAMNGVQIREAVIPDPDGRGVTTIRTSPQMGTIRELWDGGRKDRLEASSISLEGLADLLRITTGFRVVDMTGVNGRFQVTLGFLTDYLAIYGHDAPSAKAPQARVLFGPDPGTFMTNLKMRLPLKNQDDMLAPLQKELKNLGLRLVETKSPIDIVVIDHVEETPTEN